MMVTADTYISPSSREAQEAGVVVTLLSSGCRGSGSCSASVQPVPFSSARKLAPRAHNDCTSAPLTRLLSNTLLECYWGYCYVPSTLFQQQGQHHTPVRKPSQKSRRQHVLRRVWSNRNSLKWCQPLRRKTARWFSYTVNMLLPHVQCSHSLMPKEKKVLRRDVRTGACAQMLTAVYP